ncbi:helix-turn-helix transcriptional regulator [Rhodococcus sp. Eu-32]|uniref:helix-turn-helix transcriptional regulator n=1 Tax=Rhodococcus sp. Eu-32 TaxID=1017319 RepID=UPI00140309F3|nr:helix-turn-helix transcriptional regulator [Rhodococcus sp. Eu-32]
MSDSELDGAIADATDKIRKAGARQSTGLGNELLELLDRKRSGAEAEFDETSSRTAQLAAAVASLVDTTTGSDLVRSTCEHMAALSGAGRAVMSRVDNHRAAPVAVFDRSDAPKTGVGHDRSEPLPSDFDIEEGSAYQLAFDRTGPVSRDRAGSVSTVVPIVVHGTPTALVELDVATSKPVADALSAFAAVVGISLERVDHLVRERTSRAAVQAAARRLTADESHHNQTTGASTPLGGNPGEIDRLDGTLFRHLTEREADVARLVLTGASNSIIAAELVISIDTVKSHVKSILRKSGTTNRAELIGRFRSAER